MVGSGDDKGKRIASFDGDADRVVYLTFDEAGTFKVLDGNKIAALAAVFIKDQLNLVPGLEDEVKALGVNGRGLGVVQTAYANGAATSFLKENQIEVSFAKTGVKFCHHEAETYAIGVYFEANGHGTTIFKPDVVKLFEDKLAGIYQLTGNDALTKADQILAVKRLLATEQLFNQAVGDSTCDALFVEAVLTIKGWGVTEWNDMYVEKASRQSKVEVNYRRVVVPKADEMSLKSLADSGTQISEDLQAKINEEIDKVTNGRAFARPSGTEDVVRVYAEAATAEEADNLAQATALAIFEIAAGKGDKPELGKWK